MAVKSIDILNMLVFQSRKRTDPEHRNDSEKGNEKNAGEAFHLDFGDGINVLIGENGVGKTTILKMIYAAAKNSEKVDIIVNASLPETREIPESMKGMLHAISKVIDGSSVG